MNSLNDPLAADLEHILDHTRPLWEELRGGRLFVTGGTGFFGQWLLQSFLWANDRLALKSQVTVLTRSPEAFRERSARAANHPSVSLIRGDVRNFAFPAGSFSHVIHAAGESSNHLKPDQWIDMLGIITDGTKRVLEFAAQAGVNKLLFTSSGAVYGRQPPELEFISEDHIGAWQLTEPPDLNIAYREGKRLSELECCFFSKTGSLQTKIARCFAFHGPYLPLDSHFAMGNFIRDGLKGGPIQVNGDGTPFRSYLYAADLAIWLWVILFQGETCRPYNVGSEHYLSISDLARTIAEQILPIPKIEIARAPQFQKNPERYVPSTLRARSELNLMEWTRLEEGIGKTLAWHKTKGMLVDD